MSILDQLDYLLSSDGEDEFEKLYSQMLQNKYVQESRFSPAKELWREYLERIRTGCKYVSDHFKKEGVPSKLVFLDNGHDFVAGEAQFIGYSPSDDEFVITYPYAVEQMKRFDTRARRPRVGFPPGTDVSVRDYVILQAVEECHHRIYIQTNGKPDDYNPYDYTHPIEVAATEVMLQAAEDLNIPLKADPLDRRRPF